MSFSERYSRQISLPGFGAEGQQKLQAAKVLVVGAGGLGVPALQYLVAMGVGTIGIVDGDSITAANLNRQILYTEDEVGLSKVFVAQKKLSQQNPSIVINSYQAFLTPENALEVIKPYDLVIDATDNFSARYLINDACVILQKPFIYGAIQQYEGHVSVFNYKGGPTYRCLYPNLPSAGEIPDCNTMGVLGVVPGIIGSLQALEAVKVITGIGKTASGVIRIFDLLQNDQFEMKLRAKPENLLIDQLKSNYSSPVCSAVPSVKPTDLYNWMISEKPLFLMDVRERDEYEKGHLLTSSLFPLKQLNPAEISFSDKTPVITICEKGGRSLQAADRLLQVNANLEVYSLQGGMDQWKKEMGNKLVVS